MHPNDYWTTLALNLFVWLSFQYFFYNFFYPDNKKFHLHFIAALKAGAFGIKCAKYCRLHYYNNKLWFCLVFLVLTIGESLLRFLLICLLHRKHCWLSLMNMMKQGKKKKVCKSGSCNNLRNAIWNWTATKNRQKKQGWSECNKCTTFFYIKLVQVLLSKWFKNSWQLKRNWICNATGNDLSSIDVDGVEIRLQCLKMALKSLENSERSAKSENSFKNAI